MTKDKLNYEADLEIDPDNLDLECLRQATLFRRYSEEPILAKKVADRAHENLKIIRSELILEVTKDPSLANVDKATGPVIEAYYRTHSRYKEAKEEWMDAEAEVEILRVAPFAFNHKKAMLDNLVKLNGQNYFASPSIPQELGEKKREYDEGNKKETRQKIKERRRKK